MAASGRLVAVLAGRGVRAVRDVYRLPVPDAVRVAALARTIVKLRHLDLEQVAPHVTDRADLRAVLGRGRWLPTMTRHVPAPSVVLSRSAAGRRLVAGSAGGGR